MCHVPDLLQQSLVRLLRSLPLLTFSADHCAAQPAVGDAPSSSGATESGGALWSLNATLLSAFKTAGIEQVQFRKYSDLSGVRQFFLLVGSSPRGQQLIVQTLGAVPDLESLPAGMKPRVSLKGLDRLVGALSELLAKASPDYSTDSQALGSRTAILLRSELLCFVEADDGIPPLFHADRVYRRHKLIRTLYNAYYPDIPVFYVSKATTATDIMQFIESQKLLVKL